MKIAVMQSNYIPWKGYFDMINMVDVFVIYDTVQYTKNDWRNRNIIVTSQGPKWLTIPVRVESLQQRINEIQIANKNWNKKHWNSIQSNYGKSPFFSMYRNAFEEEYRNLYDLKLTDVNQRLIEFICKLLGIQTRIVRSEDLELSGDRNQRLVQVCEKLGASHYLSGPAAKAYMDRDLFENNDIEVSWMDYQGYPEYSQSADGFIHEVSILDLIFNKGEQAAMFLKSFN